MEAAVPPIYVGQLRALRLSVLGRLLALALAAGAMTVLLFAASATPDASGVGTHHSSLHMPPCQFLERTGVPCVSCGMTTSFAWFARGNVLASLYVQPMGFVLACITAITFWTSLYVAMTGRPVYRVMQMLPTRYWLIPLLSWAVLGWGWKILIHLTNVDGWR